MKIKNILSFVIMSLMIIPSTVAIANNNIAPANDKKSENWEIRRAFIEKNITEVGSQGAAKVDEWLIKNGVEKMPNLVKVQKNSKQKE
jgi:hypothetical protein